MCQLNLLKLNFLYKNLYSNKIQDSGDYKKAIKMFTKALDLQPDNIPSLFHLGMMQHKNGDLKEALHSFSDVLDSIGDDRLVIKKYIFFYLILISNSIFIIYK